MAKKRLIDLVLELDLSPDRDQARRLILAGEVQVNGHRMSQPAAYVSTEADITLQDADRRVSRAGQKLEHALTTWSIDVTGATTADVGAAGGGFTECLLRHGARCVYAIETGKGLLAWKLRQDARVIVMEETNILHLEELPEPLDFIAIDTSWTPLRRSLPCASRLLSDTGRIVALLKPNYELQDPSLLVDGVLKDEALREEVVRGFIDWVSDQGWQVVGKTESPVTGDKGNVEWLVYLSRACSSG